MFIKLSKPSSLSVTALPGGVFGSDFAPSPPGGFAKCWLPFRLEDVGIMRSATLQ